MTRVFVDTSALLTLLDRADPRHAATRDAFTGLRDAELLTHGYVIAESIAVARRRFGVDGAAALLDEILPAIGLLPVEPELHLRVQRSYRQALPSGVSFVDRMSFAVIERDSLDATLATDADFLAAGVPVMPPVTSPATH